MKQSVLGSRQRYGIFALVLLGYLVCPIQAALFSTCSAEGNTTCNNEFKNCFVLNTTEADADALSEETCGQCIDGYIRTFANLTVCQPIEDISIEDYLEKFKPIFSPEVNISLVERLVLLKLAAAFVAKHNGMFPPPGFLLAINDISAFSETENKKRNSAKNDRNTSSLPMADFLGSSRKLQSNPAAVDWVTAGAVTSVKNQGQCGCCWTIATIGAVEGVAAIDSNKAFLEDLSFQQLISCDTTSFGCNGGYVDSALQYIDKNSVGGVVSYADYPYTDSAGTTTTTCSAKSEDVAVESTGTFNVVTYQSPTSFSQRLEDMKTALAKQPVVVLLKADCQLFYNYQSGVITDDGACACTTSACLDHAVLMVGYNDTAEIPYLKVKNSWGTGWGEEGYFRVAQTATGQYGLFGVLAQGTIPGKAENVTGSTADTSGAGSSLTGSTAHFAATVVLGIVASLIL